MDEFDRAVGSLDQYSVGKALGSLDANPDDGARALQLAKATGAPPTFVHNDMEHFEQGYRTKLTADIVGKNETIAHYVMRMWFQMTTTGTWITSPALLRLRHGQRRWMNRRA